MTVQIRLITAFIELIPQIDQHHIIIVKVSCHPVHINQRLSDGRGSQAGP